MTNRSTRPVEIEGGASVQTWQSKGSMWSFGPTEDRLVAPGLITGERDIPNAHNNNAASTNGPQEITNSREAHVKISRRDFGWRNLFAFAQWEGVVEEVNEAGVFNARLLSLNGGSGGAAQPEFTDFSIDDLANDDDKELVQIGAVFYWTVGRARNAAGTVTNVSLVRFRRLPPPGPLSQRKFQNAARDLMESLGTSDEPDAAGE